MTASTTATAASATARITSTPTPSRRSTLLSSIADFGKSLDDSLSASATSFLSLSFSNNGSSSSPSQQMNHYSYNRRRSSKGGAAVLQSRVDPTELCLAHFRDFCTKTLPEFLLDNAEDREVLAMLQEGIQSLAAAQAAEEADLERTETPPSSGSFSSSSLQEVELGLSTILANSSHDLPSLVIAELHSFLGLIFQKREDHNSAAHSFMRALWIQTHQLRSAAKNNHHNHNSSSSIDNHDSSSNNNNTNNLLLLLDIATTEHRLGVALGRSGQLVKAVDQMKRAIQSYETAQVGITESCYVVAKEDLHAFQEEYQLALLNKSPRCTPRSRSLSINRRFIRRSANNNTTTTTTTTTSMPALPSLRRGVTSSSDNRPSSSSATLTNLRRAVTDTGTPGLSASSSFSHTAVPRRIPCRASSSTTSSPTTDNSSPSSMSMNRRARFLETRRQQSFSGSIR